MSYILANKSIVRIVSIINLIVATAYIILEWIILNEIKDSVFVGMLLAGTIFLTYRIHNLYNELKDNNEEFYVFLYETMNGNSNLQNGINALEIRDRDVKNIFNPKASIVFSIIFATGFGITIWCLGVWENTLLRVVLVIFLMSINLITGLGLYSLGKFLVTCYRWCDKIIFDIWMLDNRATKNLRRLRNKVLLIMSIYIAICQSSILFSNIIVNYTVFSYTIFAILLIVVAYFVPEVKMRNRTQLIREEIIEALNEDISIEYKNAVLLAKESNEGIKLEKFNSLIEMKEKVILASSARLEVSRIISFINLILISAFPVLLQYILQIAF